eukprot:COSAG02_NODE_54048_length_298_cov_0.778894_2_plen_27_part_01
MGALHLPVHGLELAVQLRVVAQLNVDN